MSKRQVPNREPERIDWVADVLFRWMVRMHSEVNERAEGDVVHWNKRKCGERGGGRRERNEMTRASFCMGNL